MLNKEYIYLDNNATTTIKQVVRDAMAEVSSLPYNASSVHSFGRQAKKYIENARQNVLEMAGASGHELVFTSCGTEANNLAIRGFKKADSILVSAVEHPSVLKAVCNLSGGIIPVDENGLVDLTVLKKILENSKGRSLVSVMLANNETGVVQPIKEISDLVVGSGGYLHCDASQAFGKLDVDFNNLNVDMMTISSHKFGAAQGAGALIIKKGLEIEPIMFGGGQENRLRAGTENIPAIVGFGVAAQVVSKVRSDLRDYIEQEILKYAPNTVIFGKNVERLPNTSLIATPNMPSSTQLIAFDLAGIAVSNGSACSSGAVGSSHVLKAMNVDGEIIDNAVRVSFGNDNIKEEADAFLSVWKRNYDNAVRAKVA